MSKEKLETVAMLNPKCQKCSKKDTCNNKTLCAYLIPKEIKVNKVSADAQAPLLPPSKITSEKFAEEIRRMTDSNSHVGIAAKVGSRYINGR